MDGLRKVHCLHVLSCVDWGYWHAFAAGICVVDVI